MKFIVEIHGLHGCQAEHVASELSAAFMVIAARHAHAPEWDSGTLAEVSRVDEEMCMAS